MSEGRRPGGLTALAVINFVFAGWSAITVLLSFVLIALFKSIETMEGPEGANARRSIDDAGGVTWIWIGVGVTVVLGVLLLISGIGYLKQKRVMGRTVGTMYGLGALIYNVAYVATVGMQFGILIGLVYPVLTLVLINTTFKDDLIN